ncbi:uncharacterized protein LOC124288815 [Haliotis rubra]|uniref:uncharacterized protein LOC124288815 n=1 Tax=Haliotis rubra TaxID=36100 RepID=UPI001EE51C49|nr:uncharacterized protein LOC124288815 [Haliotis rubra]
MATKSEKLALSIFTAVLLLVGFGLELSGSFVPMWTAPKNKTEGDVRFSLWTRVECFDTICTTKQLRIKWETTECVEENGQENCKKTSGYKTKPKTECRKADYCNSTWHHEEDFDRVPSLLMVSKCFVTPGFVTGFIALILYIIKIIIMMRSQVKTLHLKAAYLTFAAVGGAAAGVGVIIFCAMLDKEVYKLEWGPALPGVGGILQLGVAFGGYLSWRDKYGDDFDDISLSSDRPTDKPTKRKRDYIDWETSNNSEIYPASTPLPVTSNV